MKTTANHSCSGQCARGAVRGVTLLELLVSVSLLMVIIIGLYSMFNKTQQVMRTGVVSGELQESARIATDIMRRDLELMTPAGGALFQNATVTNLMVDNFFSAGAISQVLGPGQVQANQMQDYFFLTFDPRVQISVPGNYSPGANYLVTNASVNYRTRTYNFGQAFLGVAGFPVYGGGAVAFEGAWRGVGYRVADPGNPLQVCSNGVGTLYRFRMCENMATNRTVQHYLDSTSQLNTNYFQRMADGVVHLSLRAVSNTNGVGMISPGIFYAFRGTNMPPLLELEIGFIEGPALEQARAFPNAAAQRAFLTNQANRVHYFKTVIPVRANNP